MVECQLIGEMLIRLLVLNNKTNLISANQKQFQTKQIVPSVRMKIQQKSITFTVMLFEIVLIFIRKKRKSTFIKSTNGLFGFRWTSKGGWTGYAET